VPSLRVLAFGGWDDGPGYPRARTLLSALAARGVEVRECRSAGQSRYGGRIATARRPWTWPWVWLRTCSQRRRARSLLLRAAAEFRPHAVLVPYPGHLLVGAARAAGVPVVLDLFLSAHDAVVDRALCPRDGFRARLFAALDRAACRAADLVLLDTSEHADRVAQSTGVDRSRFDWVPVSDPAAPVVPPPFEGPERGQPLRVLFVGTGVPLHGLPVLVQAVARAENVHLTVIGGSADERAMIANGGDPRVELGPVFVPRRELSEAYRHAHVVAGVFGAGAKAEWVVPFKVVHGLCENRPVITGDTAAVRGLLRPGEDCFVVPVGDPAALARALDELAREPWRLAPVAAAGRGTYDRVFSSAAVGERLVKALERACRIERGPAPRIERSAELVRDRG
jgi:glycosyltransferase involved in cell wall biosynthesis